MQRRQMLAGGLLAATATAAAIGLVPTLPGRARSATGNAPGFEGVGAWLNTDQGAGPVALRGKVTLVNFWTYSCINALRTLPYLRRWHAEYGAAGLQILGIHTPEFGFEHVRSHVEDAVRELGIAHPVGQDNDYRTWRAWNNRAWPAFHLLDRDGRIVMLWEGEGHSVAMERAIRALLGLPATAPHSPPEDADFSRIRSPELYFGARHPTPQETAQSPRRGAATYAFSQSGPSLDRYELEGHWVREEEALILRSERGRLRLRYDATKVHFVAGATGGPPLRARSGADGWREIAVSRPALYTIVDGRGDGPGRGDRTVEVEVAAPGLALYSATFG
jgi:thiol-disulfide isomerase/thioredoxin